MSKIAARSDGRPVSGTTIDLLSSRGRRLVEETMGVEGNGQSLWLARVLMRWYGVHLHWDINGTMSTLICTEYQ
jgi:hypothetical protein